MFVIRKSGEREKERKKKTKFFSFFFLLFFFLWCAVCICSRLIEEEEEEDMDDVLRAFEIVYIRITCTIAELMQQICAFIALLFSPPHNHIQADTSSSNIVDPPTVCPFFFFFLLKVKSNFEKNDSMDVCVCFFKYFAH